MCGGAPDVTVVPHRLGRRRDTIQSSCRFLTYMRPLQQRDVKSLVAVTDKTVGGQRQYELTYPNNNRNDVVEGMVFRVQGYVVLVDLPPVSRLPRYGKLLPCQASLTVCEQITTVWPHCLVTTRDTDGPRLHSVRACVERVKHVVSDTGQPRRPKGLPTGFSARRYRRSPRHPPSESLLLQPGGRTRTVST